MAILLKPGDYRWKETAGGTGWVLLRHDPIAGSQTRLLRYSPETVVPSTRLDHTVQWLVTRGQASCGSLELKRGGYFVWPYGTERAAIRPGPEGYAVLSLATDDPLLPRRTLLNIPDVDMLPWEADVAAVDGPLLEKRRLERDPQSDAGAELWRLQPGAPLPLDPATALQEWFILHGSLRWESERFPATSFLAFLAGEERGAIAALDRPVVLFVNQHTR